MDFKNKNQNFQKNNNQNRPQNQPQQQPVQTAQPTVQTTVQTIEAPAPVAQPTITAEEQKLNDIRKAIAWLGKQFTSLRKWNGRDSNIYCAISVTNAKPPSPAYANPQELAQALMELGKANSFYVEYPLRLGANETAKGRLISVSTDGELICALQLSYNVSGVNGGDIRTVTRRQVVDTASGEIVPTVQVQPDEAFGSLI